ncbi:unnamed protein product [Prunus brigantina]
MEAAQMICVPTSMISGCVWRTVKKIQDSELKNTLISEVGFPN